MPKTDYEARFYDALRRIKSYRTPEQLRRSAERDYGLASHEALEMAYENMQCEARDALKGYRKPKPVAASHREDIDAEEGSEAVVEWRARSTRVVLEARPK